jgi:hypothetical protein
MLRLFSHHPRPANASAQRSSEPKIQASFVHIRLYVYIYWAQSKAGLFTRPFAPHGL